MRCTPGLRKNPADGCGAAGAHFPRPVPRSVPRQPDRLGSATRHLLTHTETTMNDGAEPHNQKARSVWNAPGSLDDEISRSVSGSIDHAFARLEPAAGERILDLATGTGWASRCVARSC